MYISAKRHVVEKKAGTVEYFNADVTYVIFRN